MSQKRPLTESKSTGVVFRPRRGREASKQKTASAHELLVPGLQQIMLDEDEDSFKRRTHSAPLSLEASSVARELKRLSDSLQSAYARRKNDIPVDRHRRHTVGGFGRGVETRSSSKASTSSQDTSYVHAAEESKGTVL